MGRGTTAVLLCKRRRVISSSGIQSIRKYIYMNSKAGLTNNSSNEQFSLRIIMNACLNLMGLSNANGSGSGM